MFKPGVQIRALSTQILLAIVEADRLLSGRAVVTAVTDGKHKAGSLHYTGFAVDFRMPANPPQFVGELRASLSDEYDVILEDDHVHVEYQPKVPAA